MVDAKFGYKFIQGDICLIKSTMVQYSEESFLIIEDIMSIAIYKTLEIFLVFLFQVLCQYRDFYL